MAYPIAEIVAALKAVEDELPANASDTDWVRAMAKRVPKAKSEDLDRAIAAIQEEARLEAAESFALAEEMQANLELFEGLPEDTVFEDAVRIKAAQGHPRALELLAEYASQAHSADAALFDAAVDAHPAWSRDGRYYLHDETVEGPADEVSLIDWYQRAFPREAAQIQRSCAAQKGAE